MRAEWLAGSDSVSVDIAGCLGSVWFCCISKEEEHLFFYCCYSSTSSSLRLLLTQTSAAEANCEA